MKYEFVTEAEIVLFLDNRRFFKERFESPKPIEGWNNHAVDLVKRLMAEREAAFEVAARWNAVCAKMSGKGIISDLNSILAVQDEALAILSRQDKGVTGPELVGGVDGPDTHNEGDK